MPTYDPSKRRRAVRKARERGCWVYIAAEPLEDAGFDLNGEPPFYRTWPSSKTRGAVYVQLYEKGDNG